MNPLVKMTKQIFQEDERNLSGKATPAALNAADSWAVECSSELTPETSRSAIWLSIQNDAFDRPATGPEWTDRHFRRELTSRPWWTDNRLWFARRCAPPPGREPAADYVGAIALEWTQDCPVAQIHWLAVRKAMRRSGIGALLVDVLQRSCLVEARSRSCLPPMLAAETLRDSPAHRFYSSLGFLAD